MSTAKPSPLILLLLAFALLALTHNAFTPVFEAPDEVWHYAYVRWLAEGHGLPAMDDDASGANQEVAQPPLYYAVAALLSAPFPDADRAVALGWGNPGFGHQAPGTVPDNKNMLIHLPQERWPWEGAVLAVHVTRLASLLFGAATVAAAWGLGRETFGTQRGARLTAALVAFHPQFAFIAGVVSNDSAAAALCTAALWSTVRVLRRGLTLRRALVTGVLVGLATLSKTSALLLVPLAGLALLAQARRERLSVSATLGAGGAYAGAALLVGGGWYLRNLVRYGDLLGISSHVDTPWGREAPVALTTLLPELPTLWRSFWAAYGWGHVTWPAGVYWALGIGSALLLLRSARNAGRAWTRARRQGPEARSATRLAALALAALWLGGILAALLHWMRQVEAPHGRLLFPAMGAVALLLANGMEAGAPQPGRWYLLALASLSALAPGARILATFSPPRLRRPETVAARLDPADLVFGGQVRLLGTRVDRARVRPGEELRVKACWKGLEPIEEDYTVFVHLVGPETRRVAERHTYPGLGRFPTSLWPPSRAVCDVYRMPVAEWAEAPLRYRLIVGLFDATTGARLPAVNAQGAPSEPPVVGHVVVAPASTGAAPDTALDATLGERISLRGYDAPTSAAPGTTITVTLHWEALAAPAQDYVAFVHLWRPGDPSPRAQHDSAPRQGWYPTSVWETGDRVPDAHPLPLPADLAPGAYPLWAGLYRPEDGTRLPVAGPAAPYPYDLVPLGELKVRD